MSQRTKGGSAAGSRCPAGGGQHPLSFRVFRLRWAASLLTGGAVSAVCVGPAEAAAAPELGASAETPSAAPGAPRGGLLIRLGLGYGSVAAGETLRAGYQGFTDEGWATEATLPRERFGAGVLRTEVGWSFPYGAFVSPLLRASVTWGEGASQRRTVRVVGLDHTWDVRGGWRSWGLGVELRLARVVGVFAEAGFGASPTEANPVQRGLGGDRAGGASLASGIGFTARVPGLERWGVGLQGTVTGCVWGGSLKTIGLYGEWDGAR